MIKLGGLVSLKPINEADYVHVGYGKYKEKGKEKDPNAQTFEKDDNDKFTPISSDKAAKGGVSSAGKDAPKVNIFDKPKDKPKSDKSSEPDYDKYTNKSQTMTDFFKGGLSIDGLKKVADKNFGSEIASEKDLDGFLNNKFMQDVMADEHGVDRETLVSKVKDLKTALFGGDKEEPSKEEPSSEPAKEEPKSEPAKDSTGDRAGNPEVNKTVRAKAKKLGITPQKLGKEEYQKKMVQAAVAALTDSNFHSEARELIAKLEGKPEWAEDPRKSAPDMSSPEWAEWNKNSVYSSEYYDADEDTEDLGVSAAQESSWDGRDALDSIAFDLKMNGFKALAAILQSIIKESTSSSLIKLLPEGLINEGTRSQVGVIKGGKIISVYVHYDGYPSNMKDGLKKHMKDEKDVMTLIKKGGARGIYDDKDIEYYGNMKPMKGDVAHIQDYVKDAGNEASADYVYLYNTVDKKWYYAKTYDDTRLKKLF